MIIAIEEKQALFEVVQLAGDREYKELLKQMEQNPELAKTLNTPIGKNPKYRFLTDDPWIRQYSLLQVIDITLKYSGRECYFVKTPQGIYVGFIALHLTNEDGRLIVNDIKTFSFSLDNSADENQMYKDMPSFLNKCLSKYGKVSWTAIAGNKANRAYEIYTRRHKGTITRDGKYIRYVCQED